MSGMVDSMRRFFARSVERETDQPWRLIAKQPTKPRLYPVRLNGERWWRISDVPSYYRTPQDAYGAWSNMTIYKPIYKRGTTIIYGDRR